MSVVVLALVSVASSVDPSELASPVELKMAALLPDLLEVVVESSLMMDVSSVLNDIVSVVPSSMAGDVSELVLDVPVLVSPVVETAVSSGAELLRSLAPSVVPKVDDGVGSATAVVLVLVSLPVTPGSSEEVKTEANAREVPGLAYHFWLNTQR